MGWPYGSPQGLNMGVACEGGKRGQREKVAKGLQKVIALETTPFSSWTAFRVALSQSLRRGASCKNVPLV